MKVQLRRWFAIGLTSGALAVSMLAGSGAVDATTASDSLNPRNTLEQRDSIANVTAPTYQIEAVPSSNVPTLFMSANYLDNR